MEIEALTIERMRLAAGVRAPRTLHAYGCDWDHFAAWCAGNGLAALPASTDTVALYLTAELNRGRKITTATRKATAIGYRHTAAGLRSPLAGGQISVLLRGAQRIRCEQPSQKAPITTDQLRQICQQPAEGITQTRNRAVVLFGFTSALRRSNIAALELADVTVTDLGIIVHVRREKQDQAGIGRILGIPPGKQSQTCPVRALQAWLGFRGATPGPVFQQINHGRLHGRLNPNRISLIVKAEMQRLGQDPARFGAHSMRAGLVTECLVNRVDHLIVMRQTGHRSVSSVRKYFREPDPFRVNAVSGLEL